MGFGLYKWGVGLDRAHSLAKQKWNFSPLCLKDIVQEKEMKSLSGVKFDHMLV